MELVDPQKLSITSKYYAQFDQIGDAEPWNDSNGNGVAEVGEYNDINGNGQYDADMGLADYGDAEDIVVYTVHYPWSVLTRSCANSLAMRRGISPSKHAVVKNEPYDG